MLQHDYDVIVIGAGPAGLMAAIESHTAAGKTVILEKMSSPALKLTLSGKGRCNITNAAPLNDFIAHFGKNGRFLKYAFAKFFNTDLLAYFEKLGVYCKLERGGRFFPQDDCAASVVTALLKKVKSMHIPLHTHCDVVGLARTDNNKFTVTVHKDSQHIRLTAKKVVIATGGKSYPGTGSNGAGFKLASLLGHTITPLTPALVPVKTKGDTAQKLQGLSLKNVRAVVWCNNKKIDERFGEMLFTDSGISGPIILSLSKTIVTLLSDDQKVRITIDLKPALEHQTIDRRLLKEINEHGKQGFKNLLKDLLPGKMVPFFAEHLHISEDKKLNKITSEERKNLRLLLKEFPLEVTGHGSFRNALVTAGGISIKEIDPQTMESKKVKGLYFAGEVIDIDADTGGYNLQAAFSTGWIAGRAIKTTFY